MTEECSITDSLRIGGGVRIDTLSFMQRRNHRDIKIMRVPDQTNGGSLLYNAE